MIVRGWRGEPADIVAQRTGDEAGVQQRAGERAFGDGDTVDG